jgi:hypothetical protein
VTLLAAADPNPKNDPSLQRRLRSVALDWAFQVSGTTVASEADRAEIDAQLEAHVRAGHLDSKAAWQVAKSVRVAPARAPRPAPPSAEERAAQREANRPVRPTNEQIRAATPAERDRIFDATIRGDYK